MTDRELPTPSRQGPSARARVWTIERGAVTRRTDMLAGEEPLEIRLAAGDQQQTLGITMRTPGADFELAAGLLFSEGVVAAREEIVGLRYCVDGEQLYNVVSVELRRAALPDLGGLARSTVTSSACGVCGKTSLDNLRERGYAAPGPGPRVAPAVLYALPEQLRAAQGLFSSTGGIHAAGLFAADGTLIALREDVGRHNALDKLIGWALLNGRLPLRDQIVLVSGRASYELLQKCVAAGVGMVCAVSAPSSLALAVAREFGVTLVGFLRGERLNVYCGIERIMIAAGV